MYLALGATKYYPWWYKKVILPSCGSDSTMVWHQRLNLHEIFGEKVKLEVCNDAKCWLEKIQEVAPHKTESVRPLTFHHANDSNKMNKTRSALLEKLGRFHNERSSLNLYTWAYELAGQ